MGKLLNIRETFRETPRTHYISLNSILERGTYKYTWRAWKILKLKSQDVIGKICQSGAQFNVEKWRIQQRLWDLFTIPRDWEYSCIIPCLSIYGPAEFWLWHKAYIQKTSLNWLWIVQYARVSTHARLPENRKHKTKAEPTTFTLALERINTLMQR